MKNKLQETRKTMFLVFDLLAIACYLMFVMLVGMEIFDRAMAEFCSIGNRLNSE